MMLLGTYNVPTQRPQKQQSGFRLSSEAQRLLDVLASHTGVNKTGVVEMAIRDLARARGLEVKIEALAEDQEQEQPH